VSEGYSFEESAVVNPLEEEAAPGGNMNLNVDVENVEGQNPTTEWPSVSAGASTSSQREQQESKENQPQTPPQVGQQPAYLADPKHSATTSQTLTTEDIQKHGMQIAEAALRKTMVIGAIFGGLPPGLIPPARKTQVPVALLAGTVGGLPPLDVLTGIVPGIAVTDKAPGDVLTAATPVVDSTGMVLDEVRVSEQVATTPADTMSFVGPPQADAGTTAPSASDTGATSDAGFERATLVDPCETVVATDPLTIDAATNAGDQALAGQPQFTSSVPATPVGNPGIQVPLNDELNITPSIQVPTDIFGRPLNVGPSNLEANNIYRHQMNAKLQDLNNTTKKIFTKMVEGKPLLEKESASGHGGHRGTAFPKLRFSKGKPKGPPS
jgi:hypothetical protein